MPVAIFDEDFAVADKVMAESNVVILRNMIATAVATERERCAKIAENFNGSYTVELRKSWREIAVAIRAPTVHG